MPKIQLPKEFANLWLTALRSGNYLQGEGELAKDEFDDDGSFCTYCCLGVAAIISGIELRTCKGRTFLDSVWSGIPCIIRGETTLAHNLAELNDGLTKARYLHLAKEGYIFREEAISKLLPEEVDPFFRITLNFTQIADFIEDNIEYTDV